MKIHIRFPALFWQLFFFSFKKTLRASKNGRSPDLPSFLSLFLFETPSLRRLRHMPPHPDLSRTLETWFSAPSTPSNIVHKCQASQKKPPFPSCSLLFILFCRPTLCSPLQTPLPHPYPAAPSLPTLRHTIVNTKQKSLDILGVEPQGLCSPSLFSVLRSFT